MNLVKNIENKNKFLQILKYKLWKGRILIACLLLLLSGFAVSTRSVLYNDIKERVELEVLKKEIKPLISDLENRLKKIRLELIKN